MKGLLQALASGMPLALSSNNSVESVWVLSPSVGERVDHETFTIVARARGFTQGDDLSVQVRVINSTTSCERTSTVCESGVVNQKGLEVIMPQPGTMCDSSDHFPIVVNASGFEKDEQLTVQVRVTDNTTSNVVTENIPVSTI
jgi:hypothetical protein